jgi:D-inositol-3-phosphate glycosyltransferase
MARILVVSSLYPTIDRPEVGAFVARRVDRMRRQSVDVQVAAARTYQHGAFRRLAEMARNSIIPGHFDGIEAHVLFPAGFIGLLAHWRHRVPFIVYAHGADVRDSAWRSPVHTILSKVVARQAGFVVTNSNATARYVRRLGVEATVIPPGVDFDVFRPGSRTDARVRLGLPPDRIIALYVGATSLRKGADQFAAAVSAVPEVLGVVVGAGELDSVIARDWPTIKRVGVQAPDEIPTWMQASDVVIVPSRAEPLGLAAVEALATGTPVIATAVDGLTEVVKDDLNGRIVPPGDIHALTNVLRELSRDQVARQRYAQAGRRSVERHDGRVTDAEMAVLWRQLGVTLGGRTFAASDG